MTGDHDDLTATGHFKRLSGPAFPDLESKLRSVALPEAQTQTILKATAADPELAFAMETFADLALNMALKDPLTNLYKAHYLEMRYNTDLIEVVKRGVLVAGVIVTDADKFKEVNDTKGHVFADKFLQAFGERLTKSLRPYDLTARMGGDEFVIIVVERDTESVKRTIERLQNEINQPYHIGNENVSIGISLGSVVATADNYFQYSRFLSAKEGADLNMLENKRERKAQLAPAGGQPGNDSLS